MMHKRVMYAHCKHVYGFVEFRNRDKFKQIIQAKIIKPIEPSGISISILLTLNIRIHGYNPMTRGVKGHYAVDACPPEEGFGAKGHCAELRSLRVVIIGNDRLGLDAPAHFCGAHAFRQGRVCNRGPRTQQLVRGRLSLFHLFAGR